MLVITIMETAQNKERGDSMNKWLPVIPLGAAGSHSCFEFIRRDNIHVKLLVVRSHSEIRVP
jgi:hypothetical protein